MNLELEPYQEQARDFVLANRNCALFLDCGLGKTVITLSALADIFDSLGSKGVLVVAPLRVARLVWPMEVEKFHELNWIKVSVLHGAKKTERLKDTAHIYTINYEGLIWLSEKLNKTPIKSWPFDTIVWDELTKMKAHSTHRFKRFKSLIPKFKRRIGLTGTPIPNGHLDLFGQFYVLDSGERLGTSFHWFRDRYFRKADYQGFSWEPLDGSLEKINQKISDITLRMGATEYLKITPPDFKDVELKLTKDLLAGYKLLEKELFIVLDSGTEVEVFNAAALMGKCVQYAGGSVYVNGNHEWEPIHNIKLNALDNILTSHEEPVIVAYTFRHEAERIMERYPNAVWLRSGMTDTQERELQRKWDNGEIEILLCHPGSAGHGLNLQYGGRVVVWYTLNWSLELYLQLNKRVDRKGQKEKPIIYRLIVLDTVDEVVSSVLELKENSQTQLLRALQLYRESKR